MQKKISKTTNFLIVGALLTGIVIGLASVREVRAFVFGSTQTIRKFINLIDTPADYTEAGLKFVRVNTGETALEFIDISEVATFYDKTTATYTGNLTSGSDTGYIAGNVICNAEFSGSHLCSQAEILITIETEDLSELSGWEGVAWMNTGAAKYSPADLPVNDCNGFTHGTADTYLGNFWMFDTSDGGVGGCGHCANTYPLACCK